MADAGLSNGSGPPHELPRIRTNRSAGAESGSGMDGSANGHPPPHDLPSADRTASSENGSRVDIDPEEAHVAPPSHEPPSADRSARLGTGFRVDYPDEANEDSPTRRERRWAAPREYPRMSVTFSPDPEDPEGNQSRLRDALASYQFATQSLLTMTGLANLHPRTRGRWFPAYALWYTREADVELSMGFSVSELAPRWERVDLGLLQVTRREVRENLVVQVGGADVRHCYADSAHYDIHEDSMTW